MAVTDTTTKRCTKCGEVKLIAEFSKDSGKRDGLTCYCKACAKAATAAYRAANPDKAKAAQLAWYAANREKRLAYLSAWRTANIEKYRAAIAAWNTTNIDRRRAANAAWRAANAERVKATKSAWQKANPDKSMAASAKWLASNRDKVNARIAKWKADNKEFVRIYDHNRRARKREAGGKLSKGLADRLFKLQKGKCACCGKPLGDDYHLDHRMPLALGGANEDWNMQLLTAKCNLQKNAKHPVDFMRQRGFLL